MVVEINERLDGQAAGFVAGHDGVVHDLLTSDLRDESELHQGRLLWQVKELKLKLREKVSTRARTIGLAAATAKDGNH